MQQVGIFEQMRSEHRRVLGELEALEAAASGAAGADRKWPEDGIRKFLVSTRRQFDAHMEAEDDVLFPALMETLPQVAPTVDPLRAEHAALRTMFAQLDATLRDPAGAERDEQIGVQMRDLVDLLRIHVRKEEAVVLSVAERMLRPLEVEALAARLAAGARAPKSQNPRAGRSKGAHS